MPGFYKKLLLLSILLLSLMGGAAFAQTQGRFYFAGFMGLNVMGKQDFTESSTGANGEISLSSGYNFAGALGFQLTPQLRLEGEFSYLNNDLEHIAVSGIGSATLGGDLKTKLAMINLYYDFDVNWPVKPFVGAGIGYAWHDGSINDVSGLATSISESTSGYAWQVGGGLQYPVNDDFSVIGSYRYIDGADLDFGGYNIDYGAHEFRLGLKWALPFE